MPPCRAMFCRARSFFEPETDPAAQEPKALLRRLVNTQLAPSPLCRAAYTEQALKAAAQTGTRQYVILGAGLDTFAFREPAFLVEGRVFEVDHPLTQADKLAWIDRAGGALEAFEHVNYCLAIREK